MGGIAGGLFAIFESLGFLFFLTLIGRSRAGRPSLRSHKVIVGGIFFGVATGAVALISSPNAMVASTVIGAFVGFIIALVLNAYVSKIDEEKKSEERDRKWRKQQIAKGLDPDNPKCFIATAAFGSEHAPEVVKLRAWRDKDLLRSSKGRTFVQLYYRISPPLAQAIGDSPILRTLARHVLKVFASFVCKL